MQQLQEDYNINYDRIHTILPDNNEKLSYEQIQTIFYLSQSASMLNLLTTNTTTNFLIYNFVYGSNTKKKFTNHAIDSRQENVKNFISYKIFTNNIDSSLFNTEKNELSKDEINLKLQILLNALKPSNLQSKENLELIDKFKIIVMKDRKYDETFNFEDFNKHIDDIVKQYLNIITKIKNKVHNSKINKKIFGCKFILDGINNKIISFIVQCFVTDESLKCVSLTKKSVQPTEMLQNVEKLFNTIQQNINKIKETHAKTNILLNFVNYCKSK